MEFDPRRQAEIYDELKHRPTAYLILTVMMMNRTPTPESVGVSEEDFREGVRVLEQTGYVDYAGIRLKPEALAPRIHVAKAYVASPAAKAIVARYGKDVKAVKNVPDAEKLVDWAIKDGWNSERLNACIDTYKLRNVKVDEIHRQPAEKFFSEGYWTQFEPTKRQSDPFKLPIGEGE